MGVRSWRSFFVLLWVYFFVIGSAGANTICEERGCNCTIKAASWKNVNCTLSDLQELRLEASSIPKEVYEIFISGGERIVLTRRSFDQVPGLNLLHIDGVRSLVMEKQSFRNLTSPSLLIRIQNCDEFSIKTSAFENVQSAIEVEITNCAKLVLEKSCFNKLRSAYFKNIGKLTLSEHTFEFKNQGSLGRHGPVTIIFFDNVTIPIIPRNTFFSTLAQLTLKNAIIGKIESGAFYANTISSLSLINCKVDTIKSNALIGSTIVYSFEIRNCTIKKIETGAIMAIFSNFSVEHSSITDIQSGAINSSVVAQVEIAANEIVNIHTSGFVFQNWNKISFEQNIIKFLHTNFVVAPINEDVKEFVFAENDIFNVQAGALSFVPDLDDRAFVFKDNFFNQTCHCTIDEWIVELITVNITSKINRIRHNTFCTVNSLLSQCFELQVGVINTQNFTELVCNTKNTIICEPYRGEVKIVNTTSEMFAPNNLPETTNWLTLIISVASILLFIFIATFIVMLIRGSRWLKRKGYFRKIQYSNSQNEHSNDEENTIETVDESDKLDISEDLTLELLQELSRKLDDPNSHQEASEMIEQLYQKYIRNSGENNNRQDEEAHLYEELTNLQQNGIASDANKEENGPRSILRLMEEKFNTQFEEIEAEEVRPALAGDYSEPSDAAVHLYSELKQNRDSESENKDSLKSRGSSNMAFRPLPDKPGSSKM